MTATGSPKMNKVTLDKITLRNFKMYRSFKIDLEPDMTILAGVNGSGKSTVLDAARIAIASFFIKLEANASESILKSEATRVPYAYDDEVKTEVQYPVEISAEGHLDDRKIEWMRSLQTSKGRTTRAWASEVMKIANAWQEEVRAGSEDLVLPLFAYYGTNRLWKAAAISAQNKLEMQGRMAGYDNCLDACIDYELMRSWFRRHAFREFKHKAPSRSYSLVRAMLANALERLVPCTEAKVDYDVDEEDICLSYIDQNDELHYGHVRSLSDGYRDIFILLADIAFRMSLLNPNLGEMTLEQTPGVVLIDELDLHLHPKWQSMIVPLLRDSFPSVQFIGTTHSPIVISSVRARNIRILDADGAYRAQGETYGRDVESILLSVMDTQNRIGEMSELFDSLGNLLDQRNVEEAESLMNRIKSLIGPDDADLRSADLSLSLIKMEDGVA